MTLLRFRNTFVGKLGVGEFDFFWGGGGGLIWVIFGGGWLVWIMEWGGGACVDLQRFANLSFAHVQ